MSKTSGAITAGAPNYVELTVITLDTYKSSVDSEDFPLVFDFTYWYQHDGQHELIGVDIKFEPNPIIIENHGVFTIVVSAKAEATVPAGTYLIGMALDARDQVWYEKLEWYRLTIVNPVPGFNLLTILVGVGLGIVTMVIIHTRRKPPARATQYLRTNFVLNDTGKL